MYDTLLHQAPFLILGGQANNSSNYPAVLPQVWPTIHAASVFVAGAEFMGGSAPGETPRAENSGRGLEGHLQPL